MFHLLDIFMRYKILWFFSLIMLGTSNCGFAEEPVKDRSTEQADCEWTRLFDGKSLHGWYTKIPNQKTGEDPEKFFQVDDGVIHVYKDQAAGTAVPNGY